MAEIRHGHCATCAQPIRYLVDEAGEPYDVQPDVRVWERALKAEWRLIRKGIGVSPYMLSQRLINRIMGDRNDEP